MQTNKNDMKVDKSISMHWHAFERSCKRQIVTDPKSRNTSQISLHPKNFQALFNLRKFVLACKKSVNLICSFF